jgi:hypothetical protein
VSVSRGLITLCACSLAYQSKTFAPPFLSDGALHFELLYYFSRELRPSRMLIDPSHDDFLQLVGAAFPDQSDFAPVGKSAVEMGVMWMLGC